MILLVGWRLRLHDLSDPFGDGCVPAVDAGRVAALFRHDVLTVGVGFVAVGVVVRRPEQTAAERSMSSSYVIELSCVVKR